MSRVIRLIDRATGELTFEGRAVTSRLPCPICASLHQRQGWCVIDQSRGLVICPRVESVRKIGEAGWLHNIDGRNIGDAVRFSVQVWRDKPSSTTDFTQMQAKYAASIPATEISSLATILGVSGQSLESFGVGWDGRCWSFPMWSRGRVCGIRLRAPDRKFCVVGSRLGLFLPKNYSTGDLVICEGESDAVALTDLKYSAVGRPGCKLAVAECCSVSQGRNVIVARDNDEAGRAGAKELIEALKKERVKSVTMIAPPDGYKDFRSWINDGATAYEIDAIIKARRGW